jgi:hypothetical protein
MNGMSAIVGCSITCALLFHVATPPAHPVYPIAPHSPTDPITATAGTVATPPAHPVPHRPPLTHRPYHRHRRHAQSHPPTLSPPPQALTHRPYHRHRRHSPTDPITATAGTLNLTEFEQNAPIFASKPFFLDADKAWYTQNVTGALSPGPRGVTVDEFDTYLDIEPYSGSVLRARKRLQINLRVEPSKNVDSASLLTPAFVPIFYTCETGDVPSNFTQQLKDTVGMARSAQK